MIYAFRNASYPIDKIHGKVSIAKYIPCGVFIASASYAHLRSRSTQVLIAFFIAFITVTWIDDTLVMLFADSVLGRLCLGSSNGLAFGSKFLCDSARHSHAREVHSYSLQFSWQERCHQRTWRGNTHLRLSNGRRATVSWRRANALIAVCSTRLRKKGILILAWVRGSSLHYPLILSDSEEGI